MTTLLDRPKVRKGDAFDDEPETKLPERYEVVNGEIVEVEPMSAYAAEVANILNEELVIFGRRTKLGRSRVELACTVPLPEDATRNRIPDLSFFTFDRWPAERPVPFFGNPIDIVPDLAVEVVSPTDDWEDVIEKAYEYLRGGVRLVWVITPKHKQVYVYKSHDDVKILNATNELDGGDVLPGFSVNVGSLFPPIAAEKFEASR